MTASPPRSPTPPPAIRCGIGLIGSGFMGRCHANAFRSVGGLFPLPAEPALRWLADVDEPTAERAARELGFERSTADWRELVESPEVDLVAITAPNALHEPIALAAAAAGKAIYCEKPLAPDLAAARRMREAVESAGVANKVAFGFVSNPLIDHARQLIAEGAIGRVTGFRGRHAENYMADPQAPHSFRTDPVGGGALADIGSHILALARKLVGPVERVVGASSTFFKERPVAPGSEELRPVEVDDTTQGILHFAGGVLGSVEANWAATARTMDLSFEISGTEGAIAFTQERMNELLLYRRDEPQDQRGYRRIEAGPQHPPYGAFCPAPGHHLGFNDLKVIEAADLVQAWHEGRPAAADFAEACAVQATVEALHTSARNGSAETPVIP